MTIIVFLIDTSASMNQRAYLGGRPTLLDVAKGAVETFVKVRQRSPESRGDRYMLLTFEEPPHNIKAAWKENLATFMNELKNLRCTGMTSMGAALKHAFDVLNINRMQTGIDTYGQGRCPFYLEPSVIVVITDGGKLTTSTGVQEEFNLPMHSPIPGCELTREPFRWDQRLFSLVLRLAGTPAIDRDTGLVPNDTSPIDAMCEVTGGRSYCVTSHRMLLQCIDSLVQKVQSGVVINFEKIGPDPPMPHENRPPNSDGKDIEEVEPVFKEWDRDLLTNPHPNNQADHHKNGTTGRGVLLGGNTGTPQPWHSCRKLIYVPKSAQKGFPVGFWPIPESFWPDQQNQTLPPRSAHPNVKFSCISQDPMVIENLPFDKYELEPSPLTQFILARKQPTICWQVFVPNSYKNSEVGHPFGYLKASTNLTCVNLFVMPYNYPVLLPLLDELFKVHRQKQTPEWRTAFTNYLKTMPPYYALPLRRALSRMGASGTLAQNLIPENMDNCLSYSVVNYLKRLKNEAKKEYEKMCNEVSSKQQQMKLVSQVSEGVRVTPKTHIKQKELISHPMLQEKFISLREQLSEFNGFIVGVSQRRGGRQGCQSFKNAFDIPRKQLLDQVIRMRSNFLQTSSQNTKLIDQDVVHSMPISQMGNYQEYLKKQVPDLREVESTPVRQHMFGNPFKIDKRMMVDEADIDLVGTGTPGRGGAASKRSWSTSSGVDIPGSPRPHKRKPGPIPKEVTVKRPVATPSSSPAVSPASSPAYIPPMVDPPDISPPPTPGSSLPLLNGDLGDDERVRPDTPVLAIEDAPMSPLVPVNNCLPVAPPSGPPVLQPYDSRALLVPDDEPPALTPEEEQPPRLVVQAPVRPQSPDSLRKHNLKVRQAAYKEVRRPGTNYKPLMEELDRMRGPTGVRVKLLKEVIDESLRFKRRNLASCLDKRLKRLMEEVSLLPGTNGSR